MLELQGILRQETNSVEWKKAGDPEQIVKTLVAFANDYEEAGGGSVVCGVEEQVDGDGRIAPKATGISAGEAKRLRDRIFELNRKHVNPPMEPRFDSVALDAGDREVLVAWTGPGSEVHFFNNAVVVRLGDKVTNATVKQHSDLVLRKSNLNWLDQPCPGATLDDISPVALVEISKGRRPIGGTGAEFLQPDAKMFGSAKPFVSKVTGVQNRQKDRGRCCNRKVWRRESVIVSVRLACLS